MKKGDVVIFRNLISEDPEDWYTNEKGFELLKTYLEKAATILHIQTHFEDDGTKQYFADVEFKNGHILRGINIVAFEAIEFDWV
jgi:hypothetical protein